jgi:membrane-bound metal-dependent hydrolase YbcI (DUF457 family)
MKHGTHVAVGALCVVPLVRDLSIPAAGGVLLMGMAGAVMPDYLDLRSDARLVLRHRGISHSAIVAALLAGLVSLLLAALTRVDHDLLRLQSSLVQPLTLAFLAGHISHLALDACTPHGIRLLLPFDAHRLRLLPSRLAIRTGGNVDTLLGKGAAMALLLLIALLTVA